MNSFERMARLPEGEPMQEPQVQVPVTVHETTLQGLTALCHWLKGYQAGSGGGMIPGEFELVMLLRQVNDAVRSNRTKAPEPPERPPDCPGKHLGALTAPPEPKRKSRQEKP